MKKMKWNQFLLAGLQLFAGKIARNIVTAFKPAITGARTSGQTIGQNFASAISSKSGAVSGASRRLVSAVRSALSNVSTYQYGVYIFLVELWHSQGYSFFCPQNKESKVYLPVSQFKSRFTFCPVGPDAMNLIRSRR